MKLYNTISTGPDGSDNSEVDTSASGASKIRTKLKAAHHISIFTEEIEFEATRSGIVEMLNKRFVGSSEPNRES